MAHTCQAALVHCMDFRLEPAIHEFLVKEKLSGNCDVISVAGAVQSLAAEDGSEVEAQLLLSKKLHGINTVILMNHLDCGAYGGHAAFADAATERAHHETELKKAKERLAAKLPDVQIKLALASFQVNVDLLP